MILNINFKKISFLTFFTIPSYKAFIKFRNIFTLFKVIYKQRLWHCLTTQIIYIGILRYDSFSFLSKFFMYLLLAFAYLLIERHIPPLIPFLIINSASISVNSSSFTSVFLKSLYQDNLGTEINFAGFNW